MKKAMSVLLCITLMVTVIAAARSLTAIAAVGDGKELSVNVNLDVGIVSGSVFTPLAKGQTLKADDVITVRISPKSDFLCGASCYVIMFDKSYFSILGTSGANAFSVNKANNYYSQACTGYAGSLSIPEKAWPSSFGSSESSNTYKAVKANFQTNSDSANGGNPEKLPGEWLVQFKLKVLKKVDTGANARIWMDERWFRAPSNTTVDGYFFKCEEGARSTDGSSTKYDFDYNFSGANIRLPLLKDQEITTAAPTTKPPVTTTTRPASNTTANPDSSTTKPGDTVASTDLTQTTGTPATTAEPVKVPQQDIDTAVDKAGIKDWDGNMANLTPAQKEAVKGYLEESGKDVEVRDEGFYYVETTVPGETATNADGSPVATESLDEDGVTRSKKMIIIAAITAVLAIAAIAVILARKKK